MAKVKDVRQHPDHYSTGSRDEAEQSHSACVHKEATGRDRTPLVFARTREQDDASHTAAELPLEMLDRQQITTLGLVPIHKVDSGEQVT